MVSIMLVLTTTRTLHAGLLQTSASLCLRNVHSPVMQLGSKSVLAHVVVTTAATNLLSL
jgi:hypothetical protein